jgi:hypothetical protein
MRSKEVYMADCENCGKPIILAWRGKSGVYCSDQCRRQAEEEGAATQEEAPKPEPAERKPKKKAAKPAATEAESGAKPKTRAKAKPKAKAEAKAEAEAEPKSKDKPKAKSRVRLPGSVVIRVLKEVTPRGLRGRMHALLRDGMTADEYRQALRAAGIARTFAGHLRWAEGAGVIRLEGKPEDW